MNRNIGSGRRCGKTTVLKNFIFRYKEKYNDRKIAIILPNLNLSFLFKDCVDEIFSVYKFRKLRGCNYYYFSDEVVNAQKILENKLKINYVCGVYSNTDSIGIFKEFEREFKKVENEILYPNVNFSNLKYRFISTGKLC